MKKNIALTMMAFSITGCATFGGGGKPSGKVIQLTCAHEILNLQEYISIDTAANTIIDNGVKTDNVSVEPGRIYYEVMSDGVKFRVVIDRTSGKMVVTDAADSSKKLVFLCGLVNPKF